MKFLVVSRSVKMSQNSSDPFIEAILGRVFVRIANRIRAYISFTPLRIAVHFRDLHFNPHYIKFYEHINGVKWSPRTLCSRRFGSVSE